MTTYPIQPSFARGELSPRLHARVDIDDFKSGLAFCQNFYVMRQGGLRRRPGLRYVAQTRDPTKSAIRPFIFSVDQTYALEFGDFYVRFHTANGTVLNALGFPYEIATPWAGEHTGELQFEQTGDVIRIVHASYPPMTLRRYGELDWRILPVLFEDGPYQDIITDGTVLHPSSNGGIIQGVVSATTAGLGTASATSEFSGGSFPAWQAFDGNGNTEWMADNYNPGECLKFVFTTARVVTGYVLGSSPREEQYEETTGDSTVVYKIPGSLRAPRGWVFEASTDGTSNWITLDQQAAITGWGEGERRYFTFNNVTAYMGYRLRVTDINQSTSLIRPVSIGTLKFSTGGPDIGLVTFTVSSAASINRGQGFVAEDVGRHIRFLSEDAIWHWFRIIAWVSAIQVDAEMYSPPLPSVNGTTSFRLGAFGDVPGWPARVGLYQDRVFYARTNDQPQTIWGSRTDDYDSFTTSIPTKPDDGMDFTVAAAGEIAWLAEADKLLFGTQTAVRAFGAANANEGFSATNFQQSAPLKTGAVAAMPAQIGTALLFIGRLGVTLHELTFSYLENSLVAPDAAVKSEHLLRAGIAEIAWAFQPNAVLWIVRNDGVLVSMTYERDQKMIALTSHSIGGDGLVESVCVIPGPDRDQAWFTVNRQGIRTIELMGVDFEGGNLPDAFYVDGGVTYDGAPTTTVSSLPEIMRNKNVKVLADGAVEPRAFVDSFGNMTLPSGSPASKMQIGFGYQSRARTLRPPGANGAGLSAKKVLKKIYVDVLETGDLKLVAYRSPSSPQQTILRQTDNPMGEAVPLVTGSIAARVDSSWAYGGQVDMIVDDPLPATILAITPGYESEP